MIIDKFIDNLSYEAFFAWFVALIVWLIFISMPILRKDQDEVKTERAAETINVWNQIIIIINVIIAFVLILTGLMITKQARETSRSVKLQQDNIEIQNRLAIETATSQFY